MDEENKKKPVTKKSWDEFRDNGLLWFINTILHMFGWAIVVEVDNGEVINAYPARVTFRGFSEESNTTIIDEINSINQRLKWVDMSE